MFCKNCGKEIVEEMKFCPVCGKTTEERQLTQDATAGSDKSFGLAGIWRLCAYVSIIGGILILLFGLLAFKSSIFVSILCVVLGVLILMLGCATAKRSICVLQDKICGNLGVGGFGGKPFEVAYEDIRSVNVSRGVIRIETASENYGLAQLDNPQECAELIQLHCK